MRMRSAAVKKTIASGRRVVSGSAFVVGRG